MMDVLLSNDQKLLMMAALVGQLGPDRDLSIAGTNRIMWLALRFSGLSNEEASAIITRSHEIGSDSTFDLFFNTLRLMTRFKYGGGDHIPKTSGIVLFEGHGNWGDPDDKNVTPAHPDFTSCRLTSAGLAIAEKLLEDHLEYRGYAHEVVPVNSPKPTFTE